MRFEIFKCVACKLAARVRVNQIFFSRIERVRKFIVGKAQFIKALRLVLRQSAEQVSGARMAGLLAGLPVSVPGETVNRLCASGMAAIANVARAIKSNEGDLFIAGGVENMTRAPYVLSKATKPFARDMELFDTSLGWRFVNPKMKAMYGTDSMGQTAENVAEKYGVSRDDQDAFAVRSQQKAARAQGEKRFEREISGVDIPQKKGRPEALRPR